MRRPRGTCTLQHHRGWIGIRPKEGRQEPGWRRREKRDDWAWIEGGWEGDGEGSPLPGEKEIKGATAARGRKPSQDFRSTPRSPFRGRGGINSDTDDVCPSDHMGIRHYEAAWGGHNACKGQHVRRAGFLTASSIRCRPCSPTCPHPLVPQPLPLATPFSPFPRPPRCSPCRAVSPDVWDRRGSIEESRGRIQGQGRPGTAGRTAPITHVQGRGRMTEINAE